MSRLASLSQNSLTADLDWIDEGLRRGHHGSRKGCRTRETVLSDLVVIPSKGGSY